MIQVFGLGGLLWRLFPVDWFRGYRFLPFIGRLRNEYRFEHVVAEMAHHE